MNKSNIFHIINIIQAIEHLLTKQITLLRTVILREFCNFYEILFN